MSLRTRAKPQATDLRYGALNGPAIGLKPGVVLPSAKTDAPYPKSTPTEFKWKELEQNVRDSAKAAQRILEESRRLSAKAREILDLIQRDNYFTFYDNVQKAKFRATFADEVRAQALKKRTWFGFDVEKEQQHIIDILKDRMQLVGRESLAYFEYVILAMLTENAYEIVAHTKRRERLKEALKVATSAHEAAERVEENKKKEKRDAADLVASANSQITTSETHMKRSAEGVDVKALEAASKTQSVAKDDNDDGDDDEDDRFFKHALENVKSLRDQYVKEVVEASKSKPVDDASLRAYYDSQMSEGEEKEEEEEEDFDIDPRCGENPDTPQCRLGDELKDALQTTKTDPATAPAADPAIPEGWFLNEDDPDKPYYYTATSSVPWPWKPGLDDARGIFFTNTLTNLVLPTGWAPQYDPNNDLYYYDFYAHSEPEWDYRMPDEPSRTWAAYLATLPAGTTESTASGKGVAAVLRPGRMGAPKPPPKAPIG